MGKVKNLFVLAIVTLMGFAINVSAKTGLIDPTTLGVSADRKDEEIFIAEGAAIVISPREDGVKGAKITWAEMVDGEVVEQSVNVSEKAIIFGGGHNQTEDIKKVNILMTGGSVAQIYGGSLHAGTVDVATIVINGGNVDFVMGGGAAFLARTNCPDEINYGKAHPMNILDTDRKDATTIVNEANVIINDGKISSVFGGGESMSYTKDALVSINGGVVETVTGDGSNGYMDIATILVEGGKVVDLQAGNHGQLDKVQIEVSGGEVENLYVTTDCDNVTENGVVKDVVGIVKNIEVDVREDGKVKNLLPGNGLDNSSTFDIRAEHNTVETVDQIFADKNIEVKDYIVITFDGEEYEADYDSTLAEYNLSEIIEVEGKTFIKFETEDGSAFSIFTPLKENVVLKTVFVENKATEEIVNQLKDLENQKDSLVAEIAKIENPNLSLVTYIEKLKVTIEELSKQIEDQKEPTKPTNPDNTTDNNPNTNDAILSYAVVTLFSLSGLGVAFKKVLTK